MIARDAPGPRIVLYADSGPEGRAKANSKGRLAFPEVFAYGHRQSLFLDRVDWPEW